VPGLLTGTAVLAFGVALATPAIFMLALERAPEAERGAAMGVVSMSLDVALGAGPIAFGAAAAAGGRGAGFAVAAVVAGAGLLLALRRLHTIGYGGSIPSSMEGAG
jgi:hypothetical protein